MFKDWGFLISEMIVLLIIAALLGVFVGWLIWGRRASGTTDEAVLLKKRLQECEAKHADKDARIATLEAELEAERAHAASVAAAARDDVIPQIPVVEMPEPDPIEEVVAEPEVSEPEPVEEPASETIGEDYDGDGIFEGKDEGARPEALEAARNGQADDLKQIKGIGPKLEQLCNRLGFFHFDQIASWTTDEIAWVDANLEGFKGRVSRDKWVDQARILAEGGATEFSKRVEDGDVYKT